MRCIPWSARNAVRTPRFRSCPAATAPSTAAIASAGRAQAGREATKQHRKGRRSPPLLKHWRPAATDLQERKQLRIYVGNFAYEMTEQELREVFEAHGQVEEVHMVCDRDTGRPKGFDFVEMPLRVLKDYARANGYSVARESVDEAESGRVARQAPVQGDDRGGQASRRPPST